MPSSMFLHGMSMPPSNSRPDSPLTRQLEISSSSSLKPVQKSASVSKSINEPENISAAAALRAHEELNVAQHQQPVEACGYIFEEIHTFVRQILEPQWGTDKDLLTTYTSNMFMNLPETDASAVRGQNSAAELADNRAALNTRAAFTKFMRFIRASVRTAAHRVRVEPNTPPPELVSLSTEELVPPASDAPRPTRQSGIDAEQTPDTETRDQASDELFDTVSATIGCTSVHFLPPPSDVRHQMSDSAAKEGAMLASSEETEDFSRDADVLSSSGVSSVPFAPGVHKMETANDLTTCDSTPSFINAHVGPFSNIKDQMEILEQRYSKILDVMRRHAGGGGGAMQLPRELAVPPLPGVDVPVPGTQALEFAKTCLNQLNGALLTGPFCFWPELGEPAGLLSAALRQLVATAHALHHELELRSIAHSRHVLQHLALRRSLRRHWHEAVSRTHSDVEWARQLAVSKLAESVQRNMDLLQQLAYYANRVQKASDGRGKVFETYKNMMQLSDVKRQEVLLLRSMLLTAESGRRKLTEQVQSIQRSLVQLMCVESVHSLLEEEYVADSDAQFATLQDVVTQTLNKTEHIKREVKTHLLRKSKSVQIDRRVVSQCHDMVVHVKRLEKLTKQAAVGTEHRLRTLGTLTGHGGKIHEQTQTDNLTLLKVLQNLDEEVMKKIAEESDGVRVDITPIIVQMQALEAERESTKEQAHSGDQHAKAIKEQKKTMQQQQKDFQKELIQTQTVLKHTKKRLETIQPEHKAAMEEVEEKIVHGETQLKNIHANWRGMRDELATRKRDLEAIQPACEQLRSEIQSRWEETQKIIQQTDAQIRDAETMLDTLQKNINQEEDTLSHLTKVVQQIKEEGRPDLEGLAHQTERTAVRAADLEEFRDQQAAALSRITEQTVHIEHQTAALKLRAKELRAGKYRLQLETADCSERRKQLIELVAEYRQHVQRSRVAYGALCRQLCGEQWDQEVLLAAWQRRCRQVALCNAAYRIEINRMEKELDEYYGELESKMLQKMVRDKIKLQEANSQLADFMKAYAQKHKESAERDWQLRAALLTTAEAARRSAEPVRSVVVRLTDERRTLVQMVNTAAQMRPFAPEKEAIDTDAAVYPIDVD